MTCLDKPSKPTSSELSDETGRLLQFKNPPRDGGCFCRRPQMESRLIKMLTPKAVRTGQAERGWSESYIFAQASQVIRLSFPRKNKNPNDVYPPHLGPPTHEKAPAFLQGRGPWRGEGAVTSLSGYRPRHPCPSRSLACLELRYAAY